MGDMLPTKDDILVDIRPVNDGATTRKQPCGVLNTETGQSV